MFRSWLRRQRVKRAVKLVLAEEPSADIDPSFCLETFGEHDFLVVNKDQVCRRCGLGRSESW